MSGNSAMDIDESDSNAHVAQEPTAGEIGSHHPATEPEESSTAGQLQQSGLFAHQNDIISQLEVDSNRSDNDSSLGSEVTSYVARSSRHLVLPRAGLTIVLPHTQHVDLHEECRL
jgi:hypothetical protein